jgi:hypothetical protein
MKANISIVVAESNSKVLTIQDMGHGMSITNDAEAVVQYLVDNNYLPTGRKLQYYDSTGRLDELKIKDGKFDDFSFGPANSNAKLNIGDIFEVFGWIMLEKMEERRYRVAKFKFKYGKWYYGLTYPNGTKIIIYHLVEDIDVWIGAPDNPDYNKIVKVS